MDEAEEPKDSAPHSQIVGVLKKTWTLQFQCPAQPPIGYSYTVTLFTLAVAWESQCDSSFIEEEIRTQKPEINGTGSWGRVEGGTQVPSTHLGQTTGQAVSQVETTVCLDSTVWV